MEGGTKEMIKICQYCGNTFNARPSEQGKYCSKSHRAKDQTGPRSHYWKGGISLDRYIYYKFYRVFRQDYRDRILKFMSKGV